MQSTKFMNYSVKRCEFYIIKVVVLCILANLTKASVDFNS